MTAQIIDGKAAAARLRAELAVRVDHLRGRNGITPALAVIRVGDDPASALYVSNKIKACASVGVQSISRELPAGIDTASLINEIVHFNSDTAVHGILVQLPLPPHVDVRRVLESIAVEKDVDRFPLYSVGGLVVGNTIFPPCTPYGVIKLLEFEGIPIEGQNAVIVGASNVVGKPMGLMLLQHQATVGFCHVRTHDLAQYTILADILVVAAGRPGLITPPMVKTGAVVINVGINRMPDGSITGDVGFAGVRHKASRITPVPGGVGPKTLTMLLENTIAAAERRQRVRTLQAGVSSAYLLSAGNGLERDTQPLRFLTFPISKSVADTKPRSYLVRSTCKQHRRRTRASLRR
jgi:methylenetetrahydrofolate dehydrogenase (NADP+) / methenyltetrahydrofolate cyclohydrolase